LGLIVADSDDGYLFNKLAQIDAAFGLKADRQYRCNQKHDKNQKCSKNLHILNPRPKKLKNTVSYIWYLLSLIAALSAIINDYSPRANKLKKNLSRSSLFADTCCWRYRNRWLD
jgi:hypothetical protein